MGRIGRTVMALAASLMARTGFHGIAGALDHEPLGYVRPGERDSRRYLGDEAHERGAARAIARAQAKRERRAARYARELRAVAS